MKAKREFTLWENILIGLLARREIEAVNAIVKKAHKGHHVSKNPIRRKGERESAS
jgi:hypothetical protein